MWWRRSVPRAHHVSASWKTVLRLQCATLVLAQEVSCVHNGCLMQFCTGLLSVVSSSKWFRQYLHHQHHHYHSSRLRRFHTFLDQLPPPSTHKTYILNIQLPDCWLKSVFGRSCDRPPRHRFFFVSLYLKANALMVPKTRSRYGMLLM